MNFFNCCILFIIYRVNSQIVNLNCKNTLKCYPVYNTVSNQCTSGLNFTTIPTCFGTIVQLNISDSYLPILNGSDFVSELSSLKFLHLKKSNIKLLDLDTFYNLTNLVELDLSLNFIRFIQHQLFEKNVNLVRLNLSGNLIRRLHHNQFLTPKLQFLDLSGGFISNIDENAFACAPNLLSVDIRSNKLKTLPEFKNKTTFLLGGTNLWNCDCNFLFIIKNRNTNLIETDITCIVDEWSPNVRKHWKDFVKDAQCDENEIQKSVIKHKKIEKSTFPYPVHILNIYGYVIIGVAFIILVCCCCDYRINTRSEKFNSIN